MHWIIQTGSRFETEALVKDRCKWRSANDIRISVGMNSIYRFVNGLYIGLWSNIRRDIVRDQL
jgi:hypothetical protein